MNETLKEKVRQLAEYVSDTEWESFEEYMNDHYGLGKWNGDDQDRELETGDHPLALACYILEHLEKLNEKEGV